MRRGTVTIGMATAVLLVVGHDTQAQRGGRGGGGGRGGAVRGGAVAGPYGGAAGVHAAGGVVGPAGGAGYANRASGTVVGPAGGTRTAGAGSGSYTTQRGTTIDYGAAGRGGTTPGGVNYGRAGGGVQVTTPGGHTATRVGTAGGVSGPGGNAVGGRAGATAGSGPGGSFGSAYRGGVAVGPHGATAGGARVGAATGPGGAVSGATRAGATVGPYGVAAGRTTVARGAGGTYYASRSTLATTGGGVRSNFRHYSAFTPTWYARYPGAWFAAGWTAARVWSAPTWGTVSAYCGYPQDLTYYDYGETVVCQGGTVYMDGAPAYTVDQYSEQATAIAATGKEAKVEAKGDDFQPLGVFAMVREGETTSSNIFQLAVNKAGVVRGNYYNATTDTAEPVYGSVDRKTQRAAWTVGDRKNPVYEAGVANLTRDETTILVHFGSGEPQQFTLVRVRQPAENPPAGGN